MRNGAAALRSECSLSHQPNPTAQLPAAALTIAREAPCGRPQAASATLESRNSLTIRLETVPSHAHLRRAIRAIVLPRTLAVPGVGLADSAAAQPRRGAVRPAVQPRGFPRPAQCRRDFALWFEGWVEVGPKSRGMLFYHHSVVMLGAECISTKTEATSPRPPAGESGVVCPCDQADLHERDQGPENDSQCFSETGRRFKREHQPRVTGRTRVGKVPRVQACQWVAPDTSGNVVWTTAN